MKLVLPAPAKVNLFLHIMGRRDNGYHNIQTVFQFLDFFDELSLSLCENKKITLTPKAEDSAIAKDLSSDALESLETSAQNISGIPTSENLIIKAALLLQRETGCSLGAEIVLNKRLPIGGGLGGGSSDAATTLLGLNRLWDTNLTLDRLTELAVQLGADVPVFLRGHAAWAEGIGDQLIPIILPEPWYLLLIPTCRVITAKLFNDPRLTRDAQILDIKHYTPEFGHNDFEPIVRFDYPEVAHALDWLSQYTRSRMSGSGGVVFGTFDTLSEVSTIAAQVPAEYKSVVVRGLNVSPVQAILTKMN